MEETKMKQMTRKSIIKSIDKMDKGDKLNYHIGDLIFKNIIKEIFPICIDIVGLNKDISDRTIIVESIDCRYNSDLSIYNNPWHTQAQGLYKINDTKYEDEPDKIYIVSWCYHENYKQITKLLDFYPLLPEFHETIVIGLLHELRHIYQFENGYFGQTVDDIRNCSLDTRDKMEKDAVEYADETYKLHREKLNDICKKNIDMHIRMACSRILRVDNLL
jgi:hypothetical protein